MNITNMVLIKNINNNKFKNNTMKMHLMITMIN